MNTTPLYRKSYQYASEHDEVGQYRASQNANIACTRAIETAITEHYHDNRLSSEAARDVIAAFGLERTSYITAITVESLKYDGRISQAAKSWAKTVPVVADLDSQFHDHNAFLAASQAHPGLIDLFALMVQDEFFIQQPVYKNTADHARKQGKLEQYRASNRANIVCKREIEELLFKKWDGTGFPPNATKGLVERFGMERVSYVLACTLQAKSDDERFSSDNQAWAKRVPLYGSEDQRNSFAVSGHSVKLNIFVSQFRQEVQIRKQPKRAAKKPSIKAQLAEAMEAAAKQPPSRQRQNNKEVR